MRSFVPSYEMETPFDLSAALERLSRDPGDWKPFAGGTDLMVLLEAGKLSHRRFVNIWNLDELRRIDVSPDHITIGSLVTYTQVRSHKTLSLEFPSLGCAAAETGSIATQNRGTLGGNIANASPAADSPPALLVYDAEIELVSTKGSRWLPYRSFHTGYKKMSMRPGELIRAVRLQRATSVWKHHYRKVGTRRAQAISKVCFAGAARVEDGRIADVRIALGSVAPTPLRATGTENLLRGQKPATAVLSAAQATLASEIAPIDDMRSTAHYRRRVAQNLLAEFLEVVAG